MRANTFFVHQNLIQYIFPINTHIFVESNEFTAHTKECFPNICGIAISNIIHFAAHIYKYIILEQIA